MVANQIPKDVMFLIADQLETLEPNILVVAVLNGSDDTGLALSIWTAFEGTDAELKAEQLMRYALDAPPLERHWESDGGPDDDGPVEAKL